MKPGDPKRHWEKADAVREVVDAALGIAVGPLRQPSASEAYLMVAEKRVVGFLLAEPLEATDKLERSFVRGESRVVASPGKVSNSAFSGGLVGNLPRSDPDHTLVNGYWIVYYTSFRYHLNIKSTNMYI